MSYASREESVFEGEPWEAFWLSTVVQNFRYTSGDLPRTILGQVFQPEAIRGPGLEQTEELASQNVTITVPLDCGVAQLVKGYLPPRPLSLVIFRGHEGEAETVCSYTGMLSSAKRTSVCEMTFVPERVKLTGQLPAALFQRQCIRRLGSSRCGVNLNAYMVVTTVASVSGRTLTSPAFAAKPDGYFKAGWLEAMDTAMAIADHVGDTLTLHFPLAGLEAGAPVVAFPGCQGTEAECSAKFNNLVNHLGFARIPGVNPFGEGGIS